jgi:hypothetical protein
MCQGLTSAKNIIIKSYDDNMKCSNFKRTKSTCTTYNNEENSKTSCVVAYDLVKNNQDAENWYYQWYTNNWYDKQWKNIEEEEQADDEYYNNEYYE